MCCFLVFNVVSGYFCVKLVLVLFFESRGWGRVVLVGGEVRRGGFVRDIVRIVYFLSIMYIFLFGFMFIFKDTVFNAF